MPIPLKKQVKTAKPVHARHRSGPAFAALGATLKTAMSRAHAPAPALGATGATLQTAIRTIARLAEAAGTDEAMHLWHRDRSDSAGTECAKVWDTCGKGHTIQPAASRIGNETLREPAKAFSDAKRLSGAIARRAHNPAATATPVGPTPSPPEFISIPPAAVPRIFNVRSQPQCRR